jgi:hypothetical protein
MPVYRGVVKGNVVLLPEGADLADGATVEVRLIAAGSEADADGTERLFERRLIELGLLAEPRRRQPRPVDDRAAVSVRGRPLSEDIIEERR